MVSAATRRRRVVGGLGVALCGLLVVTASLVSPIAAAASEISSGRAAVACFGREATIVGSDAGEIIRGTAGDDVIVGLGGDDTIKGLGGNDRICGGDGDDRLLGGLGRDKLLGGRGADTLLGGAGRDLLYGGVDRDSIDGGGSIDTCYGGEANTSCELPAPPVWHCAAAAAAVAILVDPRLADGIRFRLDRFEDDLCAEGYAALDTDASFASPPAVRRFLADLFDQSDGRLEGAILVGDVPYAYQTFRVTFANPEFEDHDEEAISFQYYSDLDGLFARSAGYSSPGGYDYSFDVHTGSTDWELWISVLPMYGSDTAVTVDALNRYFDKNHAYREGDYQIPRRFLFVSELLSANTLAEHDWLLDALRNGVYAWIPLSQEQDALIYFSSPPGGLSPGQGYAQLSAGSADFFVQEAHGSGQLTLHWLTTHDVQTVFFFSGGCSTANFDSIPNLYDLVYSPTSTVLLAHGSTNESGGMGTNLNGSDGHNIATAMSLGSSAGQAVVGHVNVPLAPGWAENEEFHRAVWVFVGDPTLTLRARVGPNP